MMKQFLQLDESEIILRALNDEMPYFSNNFVKLKHPYSSFPKNFMEQACKINEKFLNKWQSKIEDSFNEKQKLIFAHYQNKYFSGKIYNENFKESLFKKCKCNNEEYLNKIILQSMMKLGVGEMKLDRLNFLGNINLNMIIGNMNTGAYRGASCAGTTLATVVDDATLGSSPTGYIQGSAVSGTIGKCYDQISINIITALGNYRLASYDDSGSNPVNLDVESGSISASTGNNLQTVTEWTFSTATNWLLYQNDNSGLQLRIKSGGAGLLRLKAQSYGAFPDPIVSPTSDNTPRYLRCAHS